MTLLNCFDLDKQADVLGKRLIDIEALRIGMLKSLPIPGTDITADGDITVGGIAFDRLNTEKKVRFVLKMATLRADHMPVKLICLDGLECLDDEHFQQFVKAAENYGKKGYQFIVTRRTNDEELKIEQVV